MSKRSNGKKGLKALKKEVSKISKMLKQNVEKKSYTHAQSWTDVDVNGFEFQCFDGISQGSADTQRVGNKITAKSLRISYQCKIGNASLTPNDGYNQMRVLLVSYTTDDPTTPAPIDEILQNHDLVNPENIMVSPYKLDSVYKYTVLYDKVHNLYWGNASGYTGGGAERIARGLISLNLKDKLITVDGGNNNLEKAQLIFVSDSGASTHPQMCFSSRLRYIDM